MKKFKYLALAAAGVIAVSCGGNGEKLALKDVKTVADAIQKIQDENPIPKAATITVSLVENKDVHILETDNMWRYDEIFSVKYDLEKGLVEVKLAMSDSDKKASLPYIAAVWGYRLEKVNLSEKYNIASAYFQTMDSSQELSFNTVTPAYIGPELEKEEADNALLGLIEKDAKKENYQIIDSYKNPLIFEGGETVIKGADHNLSFISKEFGQELSENNLLKLLTKDLLIPGYQQMEEDIKAGGIYGKGSSVSYDNFTTTDKLSQISAYLVSDLFFVAPSEDLDEYRTVYGGKEANNAKTEYTNGIKFSFADGFITSSHIDASRIYEYYNKVSPTGEYIRKTYTGDIKVTLGATGFLPIKNVA